MIRPSVILGVDDVRRRKVTEELTRCGESALESRWPWADRGANTLMATAIEPYSDVPTLIFYDPDTNRKMVKAVKGMQRSVFASRTSY